MSHFTSSLVFTLSGATHKQVRQWVVDTDHMVLRYQYARQGKVLVVNWYGHRHFQQISELPAPGEAEPWYGTINDAYSYEFQPHAEGGYQLTVRNDLDKRGFPSLFPPEPVAPYTVQSPETPQWVEEDFDGLVDNLIARRARFGINPHHLEPLALWPWWGEPLSAYTFTFVPSSVGTFSAVKHLATGGELSLTTGDEW